MVLFVDVPSVTRFALLVTCIYLRKLRVEMRACNSCSLCVFCIDLCESENNIEFLWITLVISTLCSRILLRSK